MDTSSTNDTKSGTENLNVDESVQLDEPFEEDDKNNGLGDIPDIKILEIANVLQQKIIYLTGGVDKEGHPLLLCSPTTTTLATLSTSLFDKTINYMKHTASLLWANQKFVVVIDCQNDSWGNAKSMLTLLEVFEKTEVHCIFLLRPQSFMQRIRNKDTTHVQNLSKHMIVFLESLNKLHDYVDLSQLPDTLGGFHMFVVLEWIEYTTAIERFQKTCIKVVNRVKDVKLQFKNKAPISNVHDIEEMLTHHEQLVDDIADDIHCTMEIHDTLEPIVNKPLSYSHKEQTPLDKFNAAQLKVCCERLESLKVELNTLWKNRKIYLEQAKELCLFEMSFAELSKKLLQITSILDSHASIGESLSSAQDLMDELDDFEMKKKEPYMEMMKLKEKGIAMMIVFQPFTKDPVKLRCNEMKNLCTSFETKLEARRQLLQISLDVYNCLDKLNGWCQNGVDLLASQPMEKFNNKEGAQQCLNEIDMFMKNGEGINMKKMNQLDDLCNRLKNKMIDEKLKQALTRMDEVKEMLEKREASLKKVVTKPARPVQPVKALVIDDPQDGQHLPRKKSSGEPLSARSPGVVSPFNKNEIKVVVSDDIEKNKRNKTFRKSLQASFRRPVSSPAELQMAEHEEDPEHRKKIRHVITELVDTEVVYVNDLASVMQSYFVAFDDPSQNIPEHMRSKKDVLFGNIEDIYNFHSKVFLREIQQCKDAPYLAGQLFINKKEEFQLYATYCKNKSRSEELRRELHLTSFLMEYQKELGQPLNLDSYLLKPVQRVTKYRLLLTEMLKYVSKNHLAHADILEALQTMKQVLRYVNDVMHSTGLIGFGGNLDAQGKLLLQDSFTVWESKKNALRQFLGGGKQRQVFLFEKCLIISKKEFDNGKDLGTYRCKLYLNTAEIGVTETVKGHDRKVEIWIQRRNEVYILQARTLEIKATLIGELRKILLSQFTGAKETQLKKGVLDNKLKFQDRSASPTNLSDIEEQDTNTYKNLTSMRRAIKNPVMKSSSEIDLAEDEDTDYGWSDSEFDDDDDDEIDAMKNEQRAVRFHAIADYIAVEDTEISFAKGEHVALVKEGEGGWWFCSHEEKGVSGWVPSGYLSSENDFLKNNGVPIKPVSSSPRKRIETTV